MRTRTSQTHRVDELDRNRLGSKLAALRTLAPTASYLREINELAERPRWYNALTHNCTTAIPHQAQQVGLARPPEWRLFDNGHLDELGYERGQIDRSMPFDELRCRSDITERARAADQAPDSSRRIREGAGGGAVAVDARGNRVAERLPGPVF